MYTYVKLLTPVYQYFKLHLMKQPKTEVGPHFSIHYTVTIYNQNWTVQCTCSVSITVNRSMDLWMFHNKSSIKPARGAFLFQTHLRGGGAHLS